MIEKMKMVGILAASSGKETMLRSLRELGILHIAEKAAPTGAASERFSELSKMEMVLSEYASSGKAVGSGKAAKTSKSGASQKTGKDESERQILSDEEFACLHKRVMAAYESKKTLTDSLSRVSLQLEAVSPWGDFDPADVRALREAGYEMHFYRVGKSELSRLKKDDSIKYIRLKPVDKMDTVAVLGSRLDSSWPVVEFEVPEMGAAGLREKISSCLADLEKAEETLREASRDIDSYKAQILKAKNELLFSEASGAVQDDGGVVFITGYIPEADISRFKECARSSSWAYAIDEVADDDDKVPTKVRYNKVTSLMKPVFGILGTVPGYRESDISFWFLCFFSLFFAMIIGDAGYGCLFLLAAIGLNVKSKKFTDAVLLLYVLSIANIAWGCVTGTWFGLEGAMKIPLLKGMVIPAIANYPQYFGVSAAAQQNNIMKFCFIIGTVQLSLACILNVKHKVPKKDLSFVADIGWLCTINALYYVVLLLVLNETVNVKTCFAVVGIGFLLVVCFGGMAPGLPFGKGLKAGLGGAFTTFLDTISAFGNVMSYIRLFAVGLASLAIAQSFNDMALSLSGPLKAAGIVVFVIGHALNLVMGLLSVVVHGVRLNLLEFSGQLGMEWSGIKYEPFRMLRK